MPGVLGIDTSNYTTSAAIYDTKAMSVLQKKQPLPVKKGELGLRQSDAVFHHIRQLPEIIEHLISQYDGTIKAVSVSEKPTQAKGSYMPCFVAGHSAARQIAAALRVPAYMLSHQQGHVAAAAFGAGYPDLLSSEFIAFHVSGGTTDALLVRPDSNRIIDCRRVSGSLDLKAGQLIDRVGLMLGLDFPAGPALETLALSAAGIYNIKPAMRDGWCSLSGVENQCKNMYEQRRSKNEIAMFCIQSVLAAITCMCESLIDRYPKRQLLFAGGVMSNTIIRCAIEQKFGGLFASSEFSADNAAGIALLGHLSMDGGV